MIEKKIGQKIDEYWPGPRVMIRKAKTDKGRDDSRRIRNPHFLTLLDRLNYHVTKHKVPKKINPLLLFNELWERDYIVDAREYNSPVLHPDLGIENQDFYKNFYVGITKKSLQCLCYAISDLTSKP